MKMHFKSLDSLRGLAAIFVFLNHFNHLYANIIQIKYFDIVFKISHQSVILFFVLSGFVLTLSYNTNKFNLLEYTVRRIFRIFPAYYFALGLSIVFIILCAPTDNIGIFTIDYRNYVSAFHEQKFSDVISNIILLNNFRCNLDPVVWTLAIEMVISIFILPIVWWLMRFTNNKSNYLIFLTIIIGIILSKKVNVINYPHLNNFVDFARCVNYFIIGVLLCVSHQQLKLLAKWYVLPIYLALYILPELSGGRVQQDLITAIASAGIIICALHNIKIKKFLEHKIFLFYGKISYSFYLLHMVIFYITVYFIGLQVNKIGLFIVTFSLTTAIAYIAYILIETPLNKCGKHFFNKKSIDNLS